MLRQEDLLVPSLDLQYLTVNTNHDAITETVDTDSLVIL